MPRWLLRFRLVLSRRLPAILASLSALAVYLSIVLLSPGMVLRRPSDPVLFASGFAMVVLPVVNILIENLYCYVCDAALGVLYGVAVAVFAYGIYPGLALVSRAGLDNPLLVRSLQDIVEALVYGLIATLPLLGVLLGGKRAPWEA